MASGTTNWVHEKGNVTEKDRNALKVAKRLEEQDAKQGYRWYKINERNRIFVQCDSNGIPTKQGWDAILRFKKYMGIK